MDSTPASLTNTPSLMRRIRSFVRREGRMTSGQSRALETLWPLYGIEIEQQTLLNWPALFGNHQPVVIEVGFGMGQSLADMAQAFPHQNYLGIEVHRPGVANLLKLIDQAQLSNLKIICHDAVEVLEQKIPAHSVQRLQLFFPDPWHKAKHKKRRILQAPFATSVAKALESGGEFHMATDWEDYALWMMDVMSAHSDFSNAAGERQYSQRPDYRPLTKFEARGHRLGHGVWDLIFKRRPIDSNR